MSSQDMARVLGDAERKVRAAIQELAQTREQVLVAIDGRTTSGKSSLAELLQEHLDCNLVHMDHFYLHPEQRTDERYAQPGGNVDYERVRREVIEPLLQSRVFSYAPYDAHEDCFGNNIHFLRKPVTIVEGSYSCHPHLADAYDLRVFLTTSFDRQLERVARRNGRQAVALFERRWIPLEETYFAGCGVASRCDLMFET